MAYGTNGASWPVSAEPLSRSFSRTGLGLSRKLLTRADRLPQSL